MRLFATVSLLAVAFALPAISKADITALHDDFSSATVQYGINGPIDANFTTSTGTNVDVLASSGAYGYLCAAGNTNCVDLGGSATGSNGDPQGILLSTANFAAGSYYLSFDLTGSKRSINTLTTVNFGDYSVIFHLAPDSGNDGPSGLLVTLTTPGALTFVDGTSGNEGAILNSVDVAPVPEPASVLLLSSALLLGAGFFAMRRQQGSLPL